MGQYQIAVVVGRLEPPTTRSPTLSSGPQRQVEPTNLQRMDAFNDRPFKK